MKGVLEVGYQQTGVSFGKLNKIARRAYVGLIFLKVCPDKPGVCETYENDNRSPA